MKMSVALASYRALFKEEEASDREGTAVSGRPELPEPVLWKVLALWPVAWLQSLGVQLFL